MNAVKFFVVRDFDINPIVVRSFCKCNDAHNLAKRLNNRFPMYFYRVFNLDGLNKLGLLPF